MLLHDLAHAHAAPVFGETGEDQRHGVVGEAWIDAVVEAGGAAGVVKEIRIFATIMSTGDNKIMTVPNGAIMGGNITNYSAMPTRRVDMVVGIGYDADLLKAKTILQEMVKEEYIERLVSF